MLSSLIHTLNAVGKPTELFSSPDGSRVLVLPYGGRVLGLFTPHSEQNFFWTHPALETVETAKAFYESDAWHNSGGDRTWLAPEVDFFLPDYPGLRYWQPRELDPGNYQTVRVGGNSVLVNRLTLTSSRSKASVELEITKSVEPALNPLRYEPSWEHSPEVEYSGFTLRTTLQLMGIGSLRPNVSQQVGLWDLMQMPHGGELLVSTYRRRGRQALFRRGGP